MAAKRMATKNNVILLTIDCLRADHLGCYGYSQLSPHIDELAKKGVLFTQAISNGGNTMSSFPSILTSSYPRVHIWGENESLPYRWLFLSKARKSIAQIMKQKGYKTSAFHSNPWISSFFGYDKGFDTFYDKANTLLAKIEILRDVNITHRILDIYRLGYALYSILCGNKGNTDRASVINEKAISWLKNNQGNFFIWLHYMDVHEPYMPVDSTILERMNALKLYRKNSHNLSEPDLKNLINLYDREIKYVDREVGFILSEIDKLGFSFDNTYFILTADHGQQFMEHGVVGHGYLYDEVIHVPLIIAGPGIQNTVVQEQVCHLDIGPTIFNLLNIPVPESFQGESLVPVMNGERSRKLGVISEGNPFKHDGSDASRFSFRTEKWKYILLLDENYGQIDEELYNLQEDPKERDNIIDDEREVVREYKTNLLSHIAIEKQQRLDDANVKKKLNPSQERKQIEERLRSLGYM